MLFKKKNKGNLRGKQLGKRESIGTIGFAALVVLCGAVSFGMASMLYEEKLIGTEQFADVVLIGPTLFFIWFLLRGK